MKNRITFLIISCLVLLVFTSVTASAKEITVDDDSGADFRSIQETVNSAEAGDVIVVKPGTYIENINVSKARLTIKPEANDVFIEPADSNEATIILSNVGTTLSGLNITGSIHVRNALLGDSEYYKNNNMSRITNNVIENGGIIVGSESSGNIISGNRISGTGIDVSCCGDFNEITNNEISNCPTGIYVYDERNVPPIRDNNISNCDVGIHVSGISYDLVNNEITNCGIGVMAGETGGATLIGNKITYCTDCGVKSTGGSLGTSYNNYFNNTVNIKFEEGYENTYVWNTALTEGTNIIGGSYFGGNYWAKPDGTGFSQTTVDANGDGIADSAYAISDINIDYLPLTAKYNSVLPISGFTANVTSGTIPLVVLFTDASKGGVITSWSWNFGDRTNSSEQNPIHTYSAAGNFTVNLTVSNSNGTASKTQRITVQNPKDLPVANFSTNVTSGYAPLAVQFTDLSQNSIGRGWDFTNDWQGDSGEAAPVYVFTAPGTYNVNLVAINENGTAAKTATITVLQKSSSSGGSSGGGSSSGGSGGAGGSPEPAKNVKVKELSQTFIKSGSPVKFDLAKNATSIVYLNFDSKKTVGKTTTIVEMLKNKSTLTPDAPAGEVYNYLNIWVGNGGYGSDEDNLENAVVCFKVEKSWLQEKGIDQSSISLNRYNDKKWNRASNHSAQGR